MANKNRIRITYPSSEKIYIPGKIHKINVGMRKIKILDTVTRDENGELVHKKNNPVIVYDTSGPYSDPKIPVNTQNGIPAYPRILVCRTQRLDPPGRADFRLWPAAPRRFLTGSHPFPENIIYPIVPKKGKTSLRCIMPNGASSLRKWNMLPSAKTRADRGVGIEIIHYYRILSVKK